MTFTCKCRCSIKASRLKRPLAQPGMYNFPISFQFQIFFCLLSRYYTIFVYLILLIVIIMLPVHLESHSSVFCLFVWLNLFCTPLLWINLFLPSFKILGFHGRVVSKFVYASWTFQVFSNLFKVSSFYDLVLDKRRGVQR